jgi:saccharopine dehydrogenase-like NADP-dependent oxidoreductase
MHQIAIVGAGKIGSMIADLLVSSRDYAVTVIDRSQGQLDRLETGAAVTKVAADITRGDALANLLSGKYAVLSAAPYHATRLIAESAKAAGAHYLDLTEDVASTRTVKQLAQGARTAFIRNAASRRDSSPSWRAISPRISISFRTCACGSAPCRSFRRMR